MITDRAYADQVRWDADLLRDNISEHYGPATERVLARIAEWLARGDGVAVYEDADLSSPGMGDWKITSYGSAAAQIEADQPPMRLPDIGGDINWRFVLVGTYRVTEEESNAGTAGDREVRQDGSGRA